jgi:purine-nucleoside phosphorylase
MNEGPTPHLDGVRGDYARSVLLPGDPKRARFAATEYLDGARQVNSTRGADGFSGSWRGVPVSVQSVGMGVPSAAIYYTELIRFHGVEVLVRIGSCGAVSPDLALGDLVIAAGAGTDSAAVTAINEGLMLPPLADPALLRAAVEIADEQGVRFSVGAVYTSDLFYGSDPAVLEILRRHGVLAVEMEAAGLYAIAAAEGVRSLALLTVSDDLNREAALTAAEREAGFDVMIRVALGVVEAVG